jgi:rhodanese-related sulfurtransferase
MVFFEERSHSIMSCKTPRWRLLKALLNNLKPEEFLQAIEEHPEATLLDVRTPEELHEQGLPNAIHLDYLGDGFMDQFDALDKEQTYFVYCRTGRRSLRVCTLMRNDGFDKVYNLDGGLIDLVDQRMGK